jgi:hypothetical protein
MDTHVKVFGYLHVVLGALLLVFAAALTVVLTGAAGIASASRDPGASAALPIIGLTGMALVGVMILLALPAVVIGTGLVRFRPWARIAGIVVAIFDLLWIPFGTILGVYGLWVLFSRAAEQLFAPRARQAS